MENSLPTMIVWIVAWGTHMARHRHLLPTSTGGRGGGCDRLVSKEKKREKKKTLLTEHKNGGRDFNNARELRRQ